MRQVYSLGGGQRANLSVFGPRATWWQSHAVARETSLKNCRLLSGTTFSQVFDHWAKYGLKKTADQFFDIKKPTFRRVTKTNNITLCAMRQVYALYVCKWAV
jgi:hypothetical protein